jgi:hypothetical protein
VKTNTRTASNAVHRTFFVAPLLAAWVALLAIPAAQAATLVDQVDIIDGRVDVNEDGVIRGIGFDDATDVLLFFNNNAPIRVDIMTGLVDVTENGSVTTFDDLSNLNLASVPPTTNRMDIIDGFVDVDQNGTINALDDATDIRLVRLVGSVVDQVDIIDGQVDTNEDGIIDDQDFTPYLLIGFDGAPIHGYIGGGFFNDYGLVFLRLDYPDGGYTIGPVNLVDTDLNDLVNSIPSSNQGDVIGGRVDVTESGAISSADDATDVKLVTLPGLVTDYVDVRDGRVDVTQDGVVDTLDDLNNVLFLFNDAPIRVDIIDGLVDVTENGSISTLDDLPNTALAHVTVLPGPMTALRNQVDIIDGMIDVDENGSIDTLDDVEKVQLLVP